MFTLITLLVLALLAGATFTVKKLLNKKREAISHTRKVYSPEVLRAFEEACKLEEKHFISGRQSGKSALMTSLVEHLDKCRICVKIKAIRRKKITKSKHTKRFV